MKYIHKIIVVIIICLLISTSTTSLALQKNLFKNNNCSNATISCYTINREGFPKINSNSIPYENAQFLLDKIRELENEISNNPNSIKTKQLQDEIIDLAKKYQLIPIDYSFEQIRNQITKRNFPLSFLKTKRSKASSHASEWFCNFASVGEGSSLPVIILPRFIPILVAPIPRVYMRWEAQDGYTSCGGLLSRTGFLASGELNGYALGFWGVGFSIFLPPIMAYGLFGYALFASVNAEDIEFYPPNNKPQISSPNPSNGEENVPITLSELSFRIDDDDNDLMSYTVTTDPDVGSGIENNKGNGFYNIPIGGLQSSTTYSWTVSASDGKDTTDKTYTFTTEYLAPVVSNPYPTKTFVDTDLDYLRFTLSEPQGELMDYTVETSPYIGYKQDTDVSDGTYTVPVNGLVEGRLYSWYVNVTDGTYWTRNKYVFSTDKSKLIGYWSFDEGSGIIVYDGSDFNNDGTIFGASWTTGFDDNALSFDGNDYIDVGNDVSLKPDLPITISAWIKIDDTHSGGQVFTNGRWDYPLDYYGMSLNVGEDRFLGVAYGDGDTGPEGRRSKCGTTILEFDTWYHVVGIIKGPTDMDIYINGINDGGTYSGTGGDIAYSDGSSYIGQDGSFENFFSGIIDEVKIFNGVLTENEIQELYLNPDN